MLYYKLSSNLNFFFSKSSSLIGFYTVTGLEYIKLPKFYYVSINNFSYNILVFKKAVFNALLLQILSMFKLFNTTRFIKLRIKGLGYEIRECTKKIHSFCFN